MGKSRPQLACMSQGGSPEAPRCRGTRDRSARDGEARYLGAAPSNSAHHSSYRAGVMEAESVSGAGKHERVRVRKPGAHKVEGGRRRRDERVAQRIAPRAQPRPPGGVVTTRLAYPETWRPHLGIGPISDFLHREGGRMLPMKNLRFAQNETNAQARARSRRRPGSGDSHRSSQTRRRSYDRCDVSRLRAALRRGSTSSSGWSRWRRVSVLVTARGGNPMRVRADRTFAKASESAGDFPTVSEVRLRATQSTLAV
jgi:hypothetical protein